MKNKKQKLRSLLITAELGFTPNEIKEKVEHLDQKEMDQLIQKCEALVEFQASIIAAAKKADPERFKKLDQEYSEKNEEENERYLKDMENLQEQEDEQLQQAEGVFISEAEKVSLDYDNQVKESVVEASDLQEKLSSVFEKYFKSTQN